MGGSMGSSMFGGASKPAASAPKSGGLSPNEVVPGMKVLHGRFGIGTVLKAEPVAGDALVTVDFDGMTKNMLLESSGLKKA